MPRARSPATAVAVEPMAKMATIAIASGCCVPERDRAGQREERAGPEVQELRRKGARVGEVADHVAERAVEDRDEESPAEAGQHHDDEAHSLPAQGLEEEPAVHAGVSSDA